MVSFPRIPNTMSNQLGTFPETKEVKDTLLIASDFLTAQAAPRKSARLTSALLNYRRPEGLNLIPLGSSWALDVFARVHNGIRRELIDMYNMIDAMQKHIQDLRSGDLKLFFSWWDLFSSYIEVSFDVHQKVLVPWILKRGSMPDSLGEEVRSNMKRTVSSMLSNFDTVYSQLPRRPPDETMAKIIKSLVDMHPIVEYLESFENNIPEVVEGLYKPADVKKIEKKVASFLHKKGDDDFRRMHLSIVARAMTAEVLSAWHKLLPPLTRLSYKSFAKSFEATHVKTVQKLASE